MPSSEPPHTARSERSLATWVPTRSAWLALAACGAAALALVIAWPRSAESPQPSASAALAETPAPKVVHSCSVHGEGRKLADAVDLSVPLLLQSISMPSRNGAPSIADRLAVGFAASAKEAVGLTVDPVTLDAAQAFTESAAAKLSAVTPLALAASANVTFKSSRTDKTKLSSAVLELGSGSVGLTATKNGLELERNGQSSVLWPELAGTEMTAPRAEILPGGGAAVVLRRGGRSGDVLVGLLDTEGRAVGPLTKITTEAYEFGTPTVAASDRELLVTFASRKSSSSPWRVELARAPLGQRPAASRPFVPEGLTDELGMLSPAAASLPGGGWLLQWTEGAGTKYRVRLQTLDGALTPVGAPVSVGTDDQSAGQGTVWAGHAPVAGGAARTATVQAVSFYVVRTRQGSELWATALQCP